MLNTNEVLVRSTESALDLQLSNGGMPPGHNGPYNDEETPVRNTSHWLISFLRTYELTGEKKFKEAAEKSLAYLLSEDARPMNATFWHRKNPKKDFSNGLMGQAWTIEALEYAYQFFQEEKILNVAKSVFQIHPYDSGLKAWKTVNVDGSIRGFDPTFNHQLWFAASGCLLSRHGDESIKNSVDDFLSALPVTMKTYSNGVIMHHPTGYLLKNKKERIISAYKFLRLPKKQKKYTYLKSVGYHGFNLYALGIIHKIIPNLPIFNTKLFKSTIDIINSDGFKKEIQESPYSFNYNPPGFELAFALQQFGEESSVNFFLKEDFKRSYSEKKQQWGIKNPIDIQTASARVYEIYQLENIQF
ncbi:glycoside hydrolase family protein [Algoriphagus algorifonticola]|uniref:agl cluster protein AglQ n=1 Tax=Algoriphagus algorifonticola TaxID=2593007 RepID=UPI0011A7C482|nr:agl cluster protein AglQ [Algoriphagus algorifonticola]